MLQQIAGQFRTERLSAGTVVSKQGTPSDRAYIVVEGQVDELVSVRGGGAETLAHLGPGQAFGDATITNAPVFTTCVCQSDVIAIAIDRDCYGALFASNDAAGSVFRQSMNRNLILHLLSAQQRFVEFDRNANAEAEAALRGSPCPPSGGTRVATRLEGGTW